MEDCELSLPDGLIKRDMFLKIVKLFLGDIRLQGL